MAGRFKVPDKKTLVAIIIIAVLVIAAIVGTVAFLRNRGTTEATDLSSYNEQSTGTTQEEQETTDMQEQTGEPATQSAEEQATEGTEPATTEPTGTADTTTAGGNQGTAGTGTTGGATGTTTTTTGGTGTTTTTDNIQETTISREETVVYPDQLVAEGEDKIWTPRELQASFASAYTNIENVQTPDITVTKTATTQSGSTLVQAGETITYTITVQNNTDEKIERIYVTDAIPEGTTYVSSMGDVETFTDTEGNVTSLRWLVDVDANATTTVEFTVRVNDGATETIRNVAIANGEESNETQTPIIQTEKTSVITREGATVNVAKIGDNITYTISVKNTGDVSGNVTIKDTDLETILSDGKAEMVGNVVIYLNDEIVVSDKTSQDLINGIQDIEVPANGEAKVVFTVKINKVEGEILNTAFVDDTPTDEVVVNTVDINKTKNADKTSVKVGEQITYTIELTNKGNTEGTVVLRDSIPDGTEFESATLFDSEGNEQATITEAQLTNGNYNITVPGEKTIRVEIVVTALEKTVDGEYTSAVQNTAYITEDPNTPEEPVPSEETKVANITALKASSYEGKEEGEELKELDVITYTITLTNHGDAEGTVTVSDTVPVGTTLVPDTIKVNGEGNYTEKQLNEGIDVTVSADGEATLTFQVRVNPFTDVGTKLIRNGQAKVDEEPTNPTEDTVIKEYTQVGGEKTWIDPEGTVHPTITINLLRDGTEIAEQTLENGDTSYEFTGLDRYDLTDGHEYEYTITEDEVDGYTSNVNGDNITNIIEQEYITIEGTKTWDDMDNKLGKRPVEEGITVKLLADGTPVTGKEETVKPNQNGDWKYKFENLPKYNSEGNIIEYTVSENPVNYYKDPVYTKTAVGYDILNSMDVKETSIEKTVSSIIKNGKETPVTETGNKVGTETTYPKTTVATGDTIIYDIVVKNEGNTTLQNVKVTDTKAVKIIGVTPITINDQGIITPGTEETLDNIQTTANTSNLLELAGKSTTLEKGQGYIITVSYEVLPTDVADVSKISNTAKITADGTGDKYSTSTVMVKVKFDYDIRKEITGITGKDTVSKGTETVKDGVTTITYDDAANKGDTLTYKITAVNNGTTTIENLKITDNRNVKVLTVKFSSEAVEYTINQEVTQYNNLLVGNTKKTLEPGESVEIVVTYAIGSMVGDDTGENTSTILNTAILEGKAKDPIPDPESQEPYRPVHDEAEAIIEANMKANITIKKESTTNGQELNAGSTVTYTVTLTNSTPVTGTAVLEESVPENTSLEGKITVSTSEDGTGNPIELTKEQMEAKPTLTVPGNGTVIITFTVKLKNESIGTTVENTASIGDGEGETSETIENDVKKSLNIYETKTEYGEQSVVLVVDMTLSLAAEVGEEGETVNTDRLAYAPLNADGTINYEQGYHNTRWYKLKTALDTFIDGYLEDNPGNKKSVAIVGFCGEAITTGGYSTFYTSAGAAKAVYANVFTQEQYTAAVKFAEECNGNERKFKKFFDVTIDERNWQDFYKTEYKKNNNGTYDIDVDILPIINRTNYTDETCGLSSGTNIVVGLNAGETLVEEQTRQKIITNAIIITDGIDNKDNTTTDISNAAKELMNHKVNGESTNLYAIGFTSSATGNGFKTGVNCTEYFEATNIAGLNTAIQDIIKETTEPDIPVTRWATVETQGYVSLDGIELLNNSKITFYTGNVLTDTSTVVEYANLQEFISSGYYNANNKTFNLKQFLINKNIDASATINMQVYTEK